MLIHILERPEGEQVEPSDRKIPMFKYKKTLDDQIEIREQVYSRVSSIPQ